MDVIGVLRIPYFDQSIILLFLLVSLIQASVSGGHSGGEARGYYQPSMMENPWAPLQTEDQKAEEKWLQWRESHVQPNLSFSVPP